MVKEISPGSPGQLFPLVLFSFCPLPTRLPLPSRHSWVQSRRWQRSPVTRNAPAQAYRPGSSCRKAHPCLYPCPTRRGSASGRGPRALRSQWAPHRTQHLTALREPHPAHLTVRTQPSAPHRTPRIPASTPRHIPGNLPGTLCRALRSVLSPSRVPGALPGANGRPCTGFPCGSSVLSRLTSRLLTHPSTFLGPRKGWRSPASPTRWRGPGSAPGLGEPVPPAQLHYHRPSPRCSSLGGSPLLFSALLSRDFFSPLSLPRLIRTPAAACC